jgi:hypothetical protein
MMEKKRKKNLGKFGETFFAGEYNAKAHQRRS